MSSDLLPLYHKLLQEYDRVISLTDRLLCSLKAKETEEAIESLLNQRLETMRSIQKITLSLNNFRPADSPRVDPKTVARLKSIHAKLEEKTSLLEKKETELEKLAEELE